MLKALLSAAMLFVPIMAVMMIAVFAIDSVLSFIPQSIVEAFIEQDERE